MERKWEKKSGNQFEMLNDTLTNLTNRKVGLELNTMSWKVRTGDINLVTVSR
jgi:hypothetical protein